MTHIFKGIPPLRESPFELDSGDQQRIEYNRKLWVDQDLRLLPRDRQIEENVRMLMGQQWGVWSRLFGRWIDITAILDDKEKNWRQRPVVNRLLFWFMLMHARMTENPPVIVFDPSTGDRTDRLLAEVYDPIFKTLWQDTAALEALSTMFAWMIPSGRAHLKSRVDPNIGDLVESKGAAVLSLETDDGPITRTVDDVPFAPNPTDPGGDFLPQASLTGAGPNDWEITGKAFQEHEGGIQLTAHSALEIRGQWGSQIPWHMKSWHQHRTFLTPEEVWNAFGVDMAPEITGDEAGKVGELRRLLFGSGSFGATDNDELFTGVHDREGIREFIEIYEGWFRPADIKGMQDGPGVPGGRLLITTRTKCLRDGPRPAAFRYTSPIRTFDFVELPGRPSGTSPQEALNPLQRSYNRGYAQIQEHRNLSTNPIMLVDTSTGLKDGDVGNEPGQIIYYNNPPGNTQPIIRYVAPPALGEDVYRVQSMLLKELQDLGNIEGAEGRAPSRDPSGELVKELRFNSDRPIGGVMRRAVIEIGRIAEDWLAILPTIWTTEKVFTWSGSDQVVRSIVVEPHIFEQGSVNVRPDVESMLPEGRGERQARAERMWVQGAFGPQDSPDAIRHYLEQSRFPHLDATVRPGGIHRQAAEVENGKLAQGQMPPVLEWYDDLVHLDVHERFMSSPEYLRLPVEVQQLFANHRALHRAAVVAKFQRDLRQQVASEITKRTAGAVVEASSPELLGAGPPAEPGSVTPTEGQPPGREATAS